MEGTHKYILTMETPDEIDGYHASGVETNPGFDLRTMESLQQGWNGDVNQLILERRRMLREFVDAGVPVIQIPHPTKEAMRQHGISADVEYVRDPKVSSPATGEVMLFELGEGDRKIEREVHKDVMEALGIPVVEAHRGFNEGGNSRVFHSADFGTLMIGATSGRSNESGLREQAEFLGVEDTSTHILHLDRDKTLHFDCVSMVAVDDQSRLHVAAWMDAFEPDSRLAIHDLVRIFDGELYELMPEDEKSLASNQLFTHGTVFRTGPFADPAVEARWTSIPGVDFVTFPLAQNRRTGGQAHCLTQEIYTNAPIDPDEATRRIRESELFHPDAEVVIHNNYGTSMTRTGTEA